MDDDGRTSDHGHPIRDMKNSHGKGMIYGNDVKVANDQKNGSTGGIVTLNPN